MTITALTPQKRRPHRTSVFIDGNFAFGMDNGDLAKHTLSLGMELSADQYKFLLKQVVCLRARDTALRFLAARPRSINEVKKRLETDEYPQSVVNYVIKLMLKYRYLDDSQFAKDFTASRLRQGYGRFRVTQELKQKGIALAYIEAAFDKVGIEEQQQIKEWLKRKRLDTAEMNPQKRKRCIDALIRRGFSYGDIKEAMSYE